MGKILKFFFSIVIIWCFYSFCTNCYFGIVDENEERVTDIQQILLQEQESKEIAEEINDNIETDIFAKKKLKN